MQGCLQVMISTRLFNSSMKLPTASLNFLSRRFCIKEGKPCAAGLSNRKLHVSSSMFYVLTLQFIAYTKSCDS